MEDKNLSDYPIRAPLAGMAREVAAMLGAKARIRCEHLQFMGLMQAPTPPNSKDFVCAVRLRTIVTAAMTGVLARLRLPGILCAMQDGIWAQLVRRVPVPNGAGRALAVVIAATAVIVSSSCAIASPPAYRASGTFTAGTGAITPPYPTLAQGGPQQADDICLLAVESENQAISLTSAQGFVQVPTWSPQGTGTTRLALFWKRAVGGDTAPQVADSGDHTTARIHCFSGVITSGNPWDTGAGGVDAVSDTSGSIPGSTTTVDETLVALFISNTRNATSTTNCSGWTNANLTSLTERSDNSNTVGNGGGHCMATGERLVAGAYGTTTVTMAVNTVKGMISLALRPPRTTLGNGTDPSNASIGPGGAATMADAFTFQTSAGTDTVTAVVVGLAAGTAGGLSLVEITDDAGSTVYGSVADPASDTPSITLTTDITATTTLTQYKIRVTPKSHANMPVPPGSTYSVTAMINSWTSLGTKLGSDTAGTTVTIDNLSPGNVSAATCTAGSGQNALGWTNPGDADFNSVIVLRRAGSAVGDTPVEGTSYTVGNAIGSSTVACSTASTGCTDSGLTVGTAYHYAIFSRDSNLNWSSGGVVPTGSPCTAGPSSFNVVNTGAAGATGLLSTRIAGVDIAADVVALDASNNVAGGFTGTVGLALVNDTGVACASMPLVKTLTNQTFLGGDGGRHPLTSGQFEAEAYRKLRFRITYTGVTPNLTNCSTDAFANRPAQFVNVLARDANRTTAGTANTLNNTSNPGTGTVHNAGRPFQIDATAQNGAGSPATTQLYAPDSGQPVAVLSQCGVAAVCPATPGTIATTADYNTSLGTITNTTASYNDVGAFNLVLQDRTFTQVDSTDAGYPVPGTHYISSAAVTVGRFVPDYFSVDAGATVTPRTDIVACAGSSFTYMGERMDLGFTLTGRTSAGAATPNYAGATLGALGLATYGNYSFGAVDSTAPTPLTSRLASSGAISGAWSAGSASIVAPIVLNRAASPDGPYTAFKIGIVPTDPDGVTMRAADLNLDADNSGSAERVQVGPATVQRFGRLRLQNAMGSELADLPIPMTAQYWDGSKFITNADDNCTSLTAANLTLGAYSGGINGTNLGAPGHISLGGAFASGVGSLTITKPSPTPSSPGSATVTVDLGAEAKSYFLGNWGVSTYTVNPSARAGFGLFGARPRSFIFNRENY